MSEMEHIDIETKVKIMFALGSPVSNGFLIELKKQADVELDERNRIIKYKKHGNDLQLGGVHIALGRSSDTEIVKRMMKFLAMKSENATSPMTDKAFIKEFSLIEGIVKKHVNFKTRYGLMKKQIYLSSEFDQNTKIKMIFVSNTKVHESILEKIRQNAVVEVDEQQKITKYKAYDGSLKLETKRLPPNTVWSKEENDKLWNFIAEQSKQTNVPSSIKYLSREFAKKNENSRTMQSVETHIQRKLLPKISTLNDFDVETRVRILFALSAPIDQVFLKKLRKNAVVVIDEKRRITKYKANDGSLKFKGDHSLSAKTKVGQARKKNISGDSDVSKTNEENEDNKEEKEESFDKEDDDIINTNTTRNGRLSKNRYRDNDFSCESFENKKELKNKKTGETTKRSNYTSQTLKGKKSRYTYFSDTDEETEDEESEEYEDEKEEVKAKASIRRSGRISKKRYPNNDFTCDFDNFSFNSSKSVKDSKMEEETVKLVNKTSDIPSKMIRVKNQKRKFMEYPSDDTSSSLKLKKYENDVTNRNNTESDKIVSETNENDDEEIKYNGTEKSLSSVQLPVKQEPLSYEKVQLENEEYKPDLSFLCGSTHKTMQTLFETEGNLTDNVDQSPENPEEMTSGKEFKKVKTEDKEYKPDLSFLSNTSLNNLQNSSGAEGNHTNDVDQSTGNTEEMTSGKEFMKLLRGLVDTLDSPILAEFQSKIENAIENLGDGDHNIPIEEIIIALNTGLIILNKSATMEPPTEESTSLRDFLLILRSTLSTFHSSSLNAFQLKIKETIKKLNSQDKIIPIESIRQVLETVLLLVIP